jgi:hypothetical protein
MNNFELKSKNLSHHFLTTSRTELAALRMELLLNMGWQANYCKALPLLGPPGCGKTQFAHQYSLLFEEEHKQKLRSLYIEVSPRKLRTDVSVDFLKACGDPDPAYGKLAQRMIRLEKLMGERYDVAFLDEFHRLINSETQKVEKEAADWVAHFLNRRICPLAIVGELKSARVFSDSDHFAERTFAVCPMSPFDWGVDADRVEYQKIVGAYEILTGMPQTSRLHETNSALRIYQFARGRLRQTSTLIDVGAWLARRDYSPSIRREHLADAIDFIRVGEAASLPNPFRVKKVRPVKPVPMDLSADDEP